MVKKKLPYQAPDIQETRVELESSICAGSVDIQNPNKEDVGRIQEQETNTDFLGSGTDGMFNSSSDWSNN